jgi:carbon-monoxide dehydrogenase iron sulfur subunit
MAPVERRDKEPEPREEKKESSGGISRREFLEMTGTGIAGLVVGGVVGREVFPKETTAPEAGTEVETTAETGVETVAAEGWGMENYPYPSRTAYIETVEMNCVGCGICEMACSMQHFGVINKDLARIQVRKYLLPLPKAVQTSCVNCEEEERECQKACPVEDGPAIYYDTELLHMVVDEDRCLGEKCDQCEEACPAGAIRRYTAVTESPLVCDLCTENGERKPSCVDVCPYNALRFRSNTPVDNWRIHSDEKAELIARRLYPLEKTSMGNPGWRA